VAEALYRITYDASVDEAVDVAWRLANRTRAFQKQIRQHILIASMATGLLFFAIWTYISGSRTLWQLALALVASIGCGMIFARLFRSELVKQLQKQQRKVVAEHFGGKPTIPSELELRPDAVWVRQGGMEMIFPWNVCTGIAETPDDIEIDFSPGICVVRNRHFATPDERQAFIAVARRLSGK